MLALCSLVALCSITVAQWDSDAPQRDHRQRPAEAVTPALDFDPLVGVWKCRYAFSDYEIGAIIRVELDSITCEYTGYLLVPSDFMAADWWSAGDMRWRNYHYTPDYYGRDNTRQYDGFVMLRNLEQVTPTRKAVVERGRWCRLEVRILPPSVKHEGWFSRVVGDTALILTCDGSFGESWEKVAW